MRKITTFFFILGILFNFPAKAAQLDNEIIYRTAFGNAQDVRLLVDRGANPQIKNSIGQPLIIIAAARDDDQGSKIVKSLLDYGVDVNSTNSKGETPFLVAVKSGNAETLKVLLDYLPALSVKDTDGKDLNKLAEERGDKEIIAIVSKAMAEEEARLADHQSDENLKKQIKQFAYLTCANAYLNYYAASGQNNNIDPVAFSRVTSENDKKISDISRDLKQYFKVISGELGNISRKSKSAVVGELDAIGGVEERTVAGVGKDSDLNRRCNRIANMWAIAKIKTAKKNK